MLPNNSQLFTQDASAAAGDSTTKEQQVDEIINEAVAVAAPFIPSGKVTSQVASLTGLAPAAVHLGFIFAHLFSHPKVQAALGQPAAVPAPDPAAAAAAAAAKQRQDAIAAIDGQMKELQRKLAALQTQTS